VKAKKKEKKIAKSSDNEKLCSMNWIQKKAIKINECKVVADLFEIGCNWNNRIRSLEKIDNDKSKALISDLEERLDRLFKFIKEKCSGVSIMTPKWYDDRNLKPFFEELNKHIKHEQAGTI
jgi:hypothetical protein